MFGRDIDVERVDIVINYEMPEDSDSYLHRVGRAGRFGTKALEKGVLFFFLDGAKFLPECPPGS